MRGVDTCRICREMTPTFGQTVCRACAEQAVDTVLATRPSDAARRVELLERLAQATSELAPKQNHTFYLWEPVEKALFDLGLPWAPEGWPAEVRAEQEATLRTFDGKGGEAK